MYTVFCFPIYTLTCAVNFRCWHAATLSKGFTADEFKYIALMSSWVSDHAIPPAFS